MKRTSALRKISLPALALLLSTCAQLEEGCLDAYALNLTVDADKACDNCCTFPQLRLDLLHKIQVQDSLKNLALGTEVYADGAGNPLRISDIRFYLGAVEMLKSDGSAVATQGKLSLYKPDKSKFDAPDYYALVAPASLARIVASTFRKAEQVVALRLQLGLSEPAGQADPASAPSGHPLAIQSPSMWDANKGYIAQRLVLLPGTSDTTALIYETWGPSALRTIEIPLASPLSVPAGHHAAFTLRLDYAAWLRNINILKDSRESILQKLGDNFAGSVAITQASTSKN